MNKNPEQSGKPRTRWAVIGINLLLMAAVGLALGWLALTWLDFWTDHEKVEIVPDVRNQSYESAVMQLENQGFTVEITDSVYDTKARPGYVVDQNPRVNTKVKPGRLIYLTINAVNPKMITLPRLTDISSRQARAILEGLGIKNVSEEEVISEFEGLVLGATYKGHRLTTGARVPINAAIILQVGSGIDPFAPSADSLMNEDTEPTAEHYDLF
nr:PASTA domain-containing protein [Bacteroides sp.]